MIILQILGITLLWAFGILILFVILLFILYTLVEIKSVIKDLK